ncbi:transaldolase [Patescibacteria group bacterium]|nr:transaldolase [Patescibacteria group bacterium]
MYPVDSKTKSPPLKSKIFLDGGDPNETREIINLLGFLDGQTTNPTLISKNPKAREKLEKGGKFTAKEIFEFYKKIVQEISQLIPHGSVSVEVYADKNTTSQQMLQSGKEMFSWIPNAHIKFPINTAGLNAAEQAVKEGIRVNMTLCFNQQQAAAVYAATHQPNTPKDSLSGLKNVFVSPFIGRLDDKEENGMGLIKNIIQMYKRNDHHVAVLAASIRNLDHFLYSLTLGSDIITAPYLVLKEWAEGGLQIPGVDFVYKRGNLKNISYQKLNLNNDWHDFNISHELTDAGIEKFANDWNALIK